MMTTIKEGILLKAIVTGDLDSAKKALSRGLLGPANPNVFVDKEANLKLPVEIQETLQNHPRCSALGLAVICRKEEMVDLLLSKGADPFEVELLAHRPSAFKTLLMHLKSDEQTEDSFTKETIAKFIKVLDDSSNGKAKLKKIGPENPFIFAAQRENVGVFDLLMLLYEDRSLRQEKVEQALAYSLHENPRMFDHIVKSYRPSVTESFPQQSPILFHLLTETTAHFSDHLKLEYIDKLTKMGARFDGVNHDGEGLLFYCLKYAEPSVKILEELISNGASIEKSYQELTPLMLAASKNDSDSVKVLIDAGADLDRQDKWGKTALMIAVERGSDRCIEALIMAGANAYLKSNHEMAAIDYVKDNHIRHIYSENIKQRATSNPPSNKEQESSQAFKLARFGSSQEVSKYLHSKLEVHVQDFKSFDWDIKSRQGKTLMHCLLERSDFLIGQRLRLIELLILLGASVEIEDQQGNAPLIIAVRECKPEAMMDLKRIKLLMTPITINKRSDKGESVLGLAVQNKNQAMAEALLVFGASLEESELNSTAGLFSKFNETQWDIIALQDAYMAGQIKKRKAEALNGYEKLKGNYLATKSNQSAMLPEFTQLTLHQAEYVRPTANTIKPPVSSVQALKSGRRILSGISSAKH